MILLTIRTDKPEAELGLYNDHQQLAYVIWPAHRQLAETIHLKIQKLLEDQQMKLENIQAVVIFKGPGSFTGLRIGFSVANALSYSLKIPIVASDNTETWIKMGISRLETGENETVALPEYGSPPHITQPKR